MSCCLAAISITGTVVEPERFFHIQTYFWVPSDRVRRGAYGVSRTLARRGERSMPDILVAISHFSSCAWMVIFLQFLRCIIADYSCTNTDDTVSLF